MLLSIDRVLQLIAEGKNIEKIAELADCDTADVAVLIEEARELLSKHEKTFSKRKIIIKKKSSENSDSSSSSEQNYIKEILNGAELAAIPVNTPLTMNVGAVSNGNPGHAGIGIIIFDQEDRQVGKVSDYIGKRTGVSAEHISFIRALKLAIYFQVSELRIRTDSEAIVRQLVSEFKTKDSDILKFIKEASSLINKIQKFKVEHIVKSSNDKAVFLAKKASEKVQDRSR
jgi:ribonuclease HI